MARREALVRITKTLLQRRDELRQRFGMGLADLVNESHDSVGDTADAAFDATGEELASHLAEIESEELAQVETALARIKQGRYGSCDGCDQKISVARLSALPHSTLCIECQRLAESDTRWSPQYSNSAGWNDIDDAGDMPEVSLHDLEMDLTK